MYGTGRVKIDNNSIFISGFASKNINFVSQTFHDSGKTTSWNYINHLTTHVPIIEKLQIYWLVSIWWEHCSLKG